MSEYQFYGFLALDRRLTAADQAALRKISSRAEITPTSFTNTYEWGDLKADPADMVRRWFDMHMYLANWGTRRVMFRWPERLVDRAVLDACVAGHEAVALQVADGALILDITREEILEGEWEEEEGQLAAIAPLRDAVLAGDVTLFYLVWLLGVADGAFGDSAPEPLPGLGPLTPAITAFADFFDLDPDLVQAASERAGAVPGVAPPGGVRSAIAALPERARTDLLARVHDGDPHVGAELRRMVRGKAPAAVSAAAPARTAAALLARAVACRAEREHAEAARAEAKARAAQAKAEAARRARVAVLAERGPAVWEEVEADINRRNAPGYDRAAELLADLHQVAAEAGTGAAYTARIRAFRVRHAAKVRFLERISGLG